MIFSNSGILSIVLLIIISSSVLAYLNFNMRLKIVIQGDSGSFFMGVLSLF